MNLLLTVMLASHHVGSIPGRGEHFLEKFYQGFEVFYVTSETISI